VLVMTDQQRFDQVGYASHGHFVTPNLDRVAADGVVFEHAYSTGTTCVPGRIGLLAGVQPHRVPTTVDGISPQVGVWTVARALRAAGYQTALVGKMHLRPIHADHGFDVMRMCEHLDALTPGRPADDVDDYREFLLDEGLVDWRDLPVPIALADDREVWGGDAPLFPFDPYFHPTEWIVRETGRVLTDRDRARPLFLVVSLLHPHAPYNPPAAHVERFAVDDADFPREDFSVNDGLPPSFRAALSATDGMYRPARAPGRERFAQRLDTLMRAMMTHVDDAVGRVMDKLERDRTVIALTSDHGDYGGHRGLVRKVPWIPFDDLARVPFAIASPHGPGGRRWCHPVQSSDVVATFLDYAGVDGAVPGSETPSLRPVVDDTRGDDDTAPDGWDRPVFSATSQGWPMVRRGDWKLIQRGDESALFDLAEDPGERVDRHADPSCRSTLDDLATTLRDELARPKVDLLD
jgi:choline-sulfatase